MAKSKEKNASANGLPIDEETMGVLEDQVKKGKARKFILICKGAQIKKLIVFKKGPFGTRIQKAKKEGFRGEAVCGIVTGSGVNLSFQLAGSQEVAGAMSVDGVSDKEPTKTMKLKEFLAENKLKRKPTYKIITDVSQVGNLEDEKAEEDVAVSTPTPPNAEDAATDTPPSTAVSPTAQGTEQGAAVTDSPGEASPPVPAATPSAAEPPAAADPNQAKIDAYKKELKAVKKLAATVKSHPYKAHVSGELATITLELAKADTAYKANKFTEAMAALTKAKDAANKAKEFADKYGVYAKKRAEAQALVLTFTDILTTGTFIADRNAEITAADNLADPPTRNYAAATTQIDTTIATISGVITSWYVTPNTPKIQALKTGSTKITMAEPIKAIEAEMKSLTSYITGKEYRKAVLSGPKLDGMISAAEATSGRRAAFDTQRTKTVAVVDELKKFKSLVPQIDALNKRTKAADEQASLKTRQFEIAEETLQKIEADAKSLATKGPESETYAKERPIADTAYETLGKHNDAAKQQTLLDGIKTELDEAAELAKDVMQITAANAELNRAKRDIDTAQRSFDGSADVGLAAGSAKDATSAKSALDALKVNLATAKAHKNAGEFPKVFEAVDKLVESAEANLKASKTEKALGNIKNLGEAVAKVLIRLGQQEGYAADRASLTDRLSKLKALPEAEVIKAEINPLEAALKDADKHNTSQAWDKRAEAMEKARNAAKQAEETAAQSKVYAAREKKLATTVAATSLSTEDKKKVTDAIKPAAAKAKSLKYDDATTQLVKAEATLETLLINASSKETPPDLAKIEAAAKRMMKNGSGKEIDKLIQKLPNSTKHDVLKTLAKERFGVALKTDVGQETRSAKAMLAMLAKVPDDVVDNPSLKTVERRDPAKNGGFYRASEQLVVMNGRPGQIQQGFGATIATQLPNDVEADCKPKSAASVDYFDFATLHEVGHSVDDNLQFMASREGKAEFGGWKIYGGSIEPIAKAVADWTGYNSTAEQKKAVSDLILGNKVNWPTPPAGKEVAWNAAKTKVTRWHGRAAIPASGNGNIWWSQSKTNKIDIDGTVYHEAYKRKWVSYNASARKQGLTGYQFRAPGEWFAELYAAYRMDKLKSSHPAIKWLSKIKV